MIIAGLGNPDRDYCGTRHNVGFEFIDAIAEEYSLSFQKKGNFMYAVLHGHLLGETDNIQLIKPMTYMNLSGEGVQRALAFFKKSKEDLVVVCDDVNLPHGKVRVRERGSAGGQKGLVNIIQHLGGNDFCRVRIGIDGSGLVNLSSYVLGKYGKDEGELYSKVFRHLIKKLDCFPKKNRAKLMDEVNGIEFLERE